MDLGNVPKRDHILGMPKYSYTQCEISRGKLLYRKSAGSVLPFVSIYNYRVTHKNVPNSNDTVQELKHDIQCHSVIFIPPSVRLLSACLEWLVVSSLRKYFYRSVRNRQCTSQFTI